MLAGPHATSYLADWGAEVIRVEPLQLFQPNTRGRFARPTQAYIDSLRNWLNAYPGFTMTGRDFNCWPFFQSHGKNKLSMTVDLQQEEGVEVLKQLVAVSDIVIENNAPTTIDKLGIGYEALRAVKPDIVMLRMPAYGLTGPYAHYRSLGSHLEGTSGTPPTSAATATPTRRRPRTSSSPTPSPLSAGPTPPPWPCSSSGGGGRGSSSSSPRPSAWCPSSASTCSAIR